MANPQPNPNLDLKCFIIRRGWKQKRLALALGISDVDLSRYVTGRRPAPPEVRAGLSRILAVPERELFPDPSTVAARRTARRMKKPFDECEPGGAGTIFGEKI